MKLRMQRINMQMQRQLHFSIEGLKIATLNLKDFIFTVNKSPFKNRGNKNKKL